MADYTPSSEDTLSYEDAVAFYRGMGYTEEGYATEANLSHMLSRTGEELGYSQAESAGFFGELGRGFARGAVQSVQLMANTFGFSDVESTAKYLLETNQQLFPNERKGMMAYVLNTGASAIGQNLTNIMTSISLGAAGAGQYTIMSALAAGTYALEYGSTLDAIDKQNPNMSMASKIAAASATTFMKSVVEVGLGADRIVASIFGRVAGAEVTADMMKEAAKALGRRSALSVFLGVMIEETADETVQTMLDDFMLAMAGNRDPRDIAEYGRIALEAAIGGGFLAIWPAAAQTTANIKIRKYIGDGSPLTQAEKEAAYQRTDTQGNTIFVERTFEESEAAETAKFDAFEQALASSMTAENAKALRTVIEHAAYKLAAETVGFFPSDYISGEVGTPLNLGVLFAQGLISKIREQDGEQGVNDFFTRMRTTMETNPGEAIRILEEEYDLGEMVFDALEEESLRKLRILMMHNQKYPFAKTKDGQYENPEEAALVAELDKYVTQLLVGAPIADLEAELQAAPRGLEGAKVAQDITARIRKAIAEQAADPTESRVAIKLQPTVVKDADGNIVRKQAAIPISPQLRNHLETTGISTDTYNIRMTHDGVVFIEAKPEADMADQPDPWIAMAASMVRDVLTDLRSSHTDARTQANQDLVNTLNEIRIAREADEAAIAAEAIADILLEGEELLDVEEAIDEATQEDMGRTVAQMRELLNPEELAAVDEYAQAGETQQQRILRETAKISQILQLRERAETRMRSERGKAGATLAKRRQTIAENVRARQEAKAKRKQRTQKAEREAEVKKIYGRRGGGYAMAERGAAERDVGHYLPTSERSLMVYYSTADPSVVLHEWLHHVFHWGLLPASMANALSRAYNGGDERWTRKGIENAIDGFIHYLRTGDVVGDNKSANAFRFLHGAFAKAYDEMKTNVEVNNKVNLPEFAIPAEARSVYDQLVGAPDNATVREAGKALSMAMEIHHGFAMIEPGSEWDLGDSQNKDKEYEHFREQLASYWAEHWYGLPQEREDVVEGEDAVKTPEDILGELVIKQNWATLVARYVTSEQFANMTDVQQAQMLGAIDEYRDDIGLPNNAMFNPYVINEGYKLINAMEQVFDLDDNIVVRMEQLLGEYAKTAQDSDFTGMDVEAIHEMIRSSIYKFARETGVDLDGANFIVGIADDFFRIVDRYTRNFGETGETGYAMADPFSYKFNDYKRLARTIVSQLVNETAKAESWPRERWNAVDESITRAFTFLHPDATNEEFEAGLSQLEEYIPDVRVMGAILRMDSLRLSKRAAGLSSTGYAMAEPGDIEDLKQREVEAFRKWAATPEYQAMEAAEEAALELTRIRDGGYTFAQVEENYESGRVDEAHAAEEVASDAAWKTPEANEWQRLRAQLDAAEKSADIQNQRTRIAETRTPNKTPKRVAKTTESNQEEGGAFGNRLRQIDAPIHGLELEDIPMVVRDGLNPSSALDLSKDKGWATGYGAAVVVPFARRGMRIEHNDFYNSANQAAVERVIIDAEQYDQPYLERQLRKLRDIGVRVEVVNADGSIDVISDFSDRGQGTGYAMAEPEIVEDNEENRKKLRSSIHAMGWGNELMGVRDEDRAKLTVAELSELRKKASSLSDLRKRHTRHVPTQIKGELRTELQRKNREEAKQEVIRRAKDEIGKDLRHLTEVDIAQLKRTKAAEMAKPIANYLNERFKREGPKGMPRTAGENALIYNVRRFFTNIGHKLSSTFLSPDTLLQVLDGSISGPFKSVIGTALDIYNADYARMYDEDIDVFKGKLKQHGATNLDLRRKTPLGKKGYLVEDWKALKIYLVSRNQEQLEAYLKNEPLLLDDPSVVRAAIEHVERNSNLMALAKSIREMYDYKHEPLADAFEEMYGIRLNRILGYSPQRRVDGQWAEDDPLTHVFPQAEEQRKGLDYMLKQRHEGAEGTLRLHNPVDEMMDYLAGADNFIAKRSGISELQGVLNELKPSFEATFGMDARIFHALSEMLKREHYYTGRIRVMSESEKMVQDKRRQGMQSILTFRMPTALIQTLSHFNGLAYIGGGLRTLGIHLHNSLGLWDHMVKQIVSMSQSGEYSVDNLLKGHRVYNLMKAYDPAQLKAHADPDVESRAVGIMAELRLKGISLADIGMTPIQVADLWTRASVWLTAYDVAYDGETQGNVDADAASAVAGTFARHVVRKTQPPAYVHERAPIQTESEYTKALMTFTGFTMTALQANISDVVIPLTNAIKSGDVGQVWDVMAKPQMKYGTSAFQKMLLASVVPALIYGMIRRGFRKPKKDEMWMDILTYPINLVPIVGPQVASAIAYKTKNIEYTPLALQWVTTLKNLAADLAAGNITDKTYETMTDLFGLTTGFSQPMLDAIRETAENVIEKEDDPRMWLSDFVGLTQMRERGQPQSESRE